METNVELQRDAKKNYPQCFDPIDKYSYIDAKFVDKCLRELLLENLIKLHR